MGADQQIFGWTYTNRNLPIKCIGRAGGLSAAISDGFALIGLCGRDVPERIFLQVVVAQVEGPLASAFLVVPTECHTDDGKS
jgi:hypothetical protein